MQQARVLEDMHPPLTSVGASLLFWFQMKLLRCLSFTYLSRQCIFISLQIQFFVKKLNLLLDFSRFIFSRCVSIYLVLSIHWFHYTIISLYRMSGLIKPYRLLDFHIVTTGKFFLNAFFSRSLSYHMFLQLNGLPEFCKYRLKCNFEFVTYFQSFVSIKK